MPCNSLVYVGPSVDPAQLAAVVHADCGQPWSAHTQVPHPKVSPTMAFLVNPDAVRHWPLGQ